MKLVFMKSAAVEYFRTNIDRLYTNYYVKDDGSWLEEEYPGAFEDFIEVEDIRLADPDLYTPGELEVENCKILYSALKFLSPSQASDERLWAGLCNKVFYDYLKRRWNNYELGREKAENDKIEKRFFVKGTRGGLYGNSLARWWWIGKITYDPNSVDHFEKLDAIGATDFSTKVYSLFTSYPFSSSQTVMDGIFGALKILNEHNVTLIVKPHLRPAMKYLNAYGGSVLLDSLTSEEIQKIMIRKLVELRFGEDEVINYDVNDTVETMEEDDIEAESIITYEGTNIIPDDLIEYMEDADDEIVVVNYLDKVRVLRLSDSKELDPFEMPASKEELNNIGIRMYQELMGRKINERFWLKKDQYEIVAIEKH